MKKNKISKNWINRQRRDIYVRQSKVHGYRSRSAYKLQEIDEKFKEEYAALATQAKVGNTGLYNSQLDFTTWGDCSAQLTSDAAVSGDPTTVDPKRLNAGEYAGGSTAPGGNDGKMSMGWEEDSSDHLF